MRARGLSPKKRGIGILRPESTELPAGAPRGGSAYSGGHYRSCRQIFLSVACLAMLAGTSGCISSVDGVLQPTVPVVDASGFAEGEPMMSAGTTSDGLDARTAQVSAPDTEPAAIEIAAASVVPEPAPRDGAPLLNEGEVLAFALDDNNGAPQATQKLAYASVSGANGVTAVPVAEPAIDAVGEPKPKKKTFLELLLGHRLRKQADQINGNNGPVQEAHPPATGTAEAIDAPDEEEHEADGAPFQLASVGSLGRLSPNGIRTQTERVEVSCLKPQLVAILNEVEKHFGSKPIVTSGYRSPNRNQRAGGASKSLHIQCMAADIQVEGVSKWDLATYLRTVPGHGGVGTYCRTKSVHIDIGEERSWHYPCRRTAKRQS